MHPASLFHDKDRDRLQKRMEAWPFALVIGVEDSRPHAVHSPVLLMRDGTLQFHLARPNPACKAVAQSGRALVVFTGPNDYISPDWYDLPDQVPTWNYLSVEAEGPVTAMDDTGAGAHLDALSARFEEDLFPKPAWTRDKMSPGRFEKMLGGITAFTLMPERLEGITKISQNKSPEARQKAGAALKDAGGDPIISIMMERDT